jgi:hypothetical protein
MIKPSTTHSATPAPSPELPTPSLTHRQISSVFHPSGTNNHQQSSHLQPNASQTQESPDASETRTDPHLEPLNYKK